MPKRKSSNINANIGDYRYNKSAKRKNNPPAGLAPTFETRDRRVEKYQYDPHLDPQLVWAGKAERTSFEVDVLPLHIHERVSTRAIIAAVKKPEPQLELFGNQELSADKQIEFYQHEVGWANRLILGDSLLVMNSLLINEGMGGKVQCIYIDPPYGIKYASNFQPRIDRRDVKDRDEDLTHEPEQIKAYRDTWTLGIHSYLTYLRDRLLLARELLHPSGSIFVQINDENLHLVRCLMDEVFGRDNFVSVISFAKTSGFESKVLSRAGDYLLWYARRIEEVKYHQLYWNKGEDTSGYNKTKDGKLYSSGALFSPGITADGSKPFEFKGRKFYPSGGHWKTSERGLKRLVEADRIELVGTTLRYIRFWNDFNLVPLNNIWEDTQTFTEKLYAVQTNTKVVERCILMTTDPGDLVFDPTCGSGTTAYCAEKWGRRWITCDTSRVALAIARQRLMTAKFDYYELLDPERGPAGGFKYETVPHITLESIAKNTEIDVIAANYQPEIDKALADLNRAVGENWQEWEVPREINKNWNKKAQEAHQRFWNLKRAKRQEIDRSIQRNAPQETLYDRPFTKRGVVRVSGPFTVEALPPPAISIPEATPIPQYEAEEGRVDNRASDYILRMINLLKQQGGVIFPGGKRLELKDIRRAALGFVHAEAEAQIEGTPKRVAISFGPEFGPVTASQVREAIDPATLNKFDILLVAGGSFEPDVHSFASKAPEKIKDSGLTIQCVNIAPDVLSGDLLKTNRASQIFTVFGEPDVAIEPKADGTFIAELKGVRGHFRLSRVNSNGLRSSLLTSVETRWCGCWS